MFTAAVLTISDSCTRGERVDASGPAVAKALSVAGYTVGVCRIVPDDRTIIEAALRELAVGHRLVVSTGGTGVSPRDVTPEATRAVCDRLLDGIAEQMRADGRKETPLAVLSRALCGTLDQSLLLNLPGSPRGAVTSLTSVLPLLGHALALLAGESNLHGTDSEDPQTAVPPAGSSDRGPA